jgi:hypothetical protein
MPPQRFTQLHQTLLTIPAGCAAALKEEEDEN